MPYFFDKNNLTPSQQKNWDLAVQKYKEVNDKNALLLSKTTDISRLKGFGEMFHYDQLSGVLNSHVLYEKSALFFRLLEGKLPLLYRPPCYYSYPWYSVIEDSDVWDLDIDVDSIDELFWSDSTDVKKILIQQTAWKIIDYISNTEATVTFEFWEDLGFKWRLKQIKKQCTLTTSFIMCHHDANLDRITTLDQLKKEQFYHIKKKLEKINLVLDNEFRTKNEQEIYHKYGKNGLSDMIVSNNYQDGQTMLTERRSEGLSDLPSVEEMESLADIKVNNYLNNRYSADSEGNLYLKVWILEKLSGSVNESIYMKV